MTAVGDVSPAVRRADTPRSGRGAGVYSYLTGAHLTLRRRGQPGHARDRRGGSSERTRLDTAGRRCLRFRMLGIRARVWIATNTIVRSARRRATAAATQDAPAGAGEGRLLCHASDHPGPPPLSRADVPLGADTGGLPMRGVEVAHAARYTAMAGPRTGRCPT